MSGLGEVGQIFPSFIFSGGRVEIFFFSLLKMQKKSIDFKRGLVSCPFDDPQQVASLLHNGKKHSGKKTLEKL